MVTLVVTAFIIAFGFGMVSNLTFLMILSDVNGALEPRRQIPWFFNSFYLLRIFSEHRRLYPARRRQRIVVVGCGIVSLSAMMVVMGSILWQAFHNSNSGFSPHVK